MGGICESSSGFSLLIMLNSFVQLPAWLGLSNNAEKVLLTVRGETMLRNMLKVSDDELAFSGDGEKEAKPQWMAQLSDLAQKWLKLLPQVHIS